MDIRKARWGRWAFIIALSCLTAHAGSKSKRAKKDRLGGINPSNIAVTESDFEMSMVSSYEMYATELYFHSYCIEPVVTGRGVVVAVLDGGFDIHHPAVAHRFVGGWDAIDGDYDPTDLGNGKDDDRDGFVDRAVGHGTFVASQVLDAAPGALVMPIRIRDDEGWGTNEETASGLKYAIRAGVDIINLSISSATGHGDVLSLIEVAERYGIVVVLSAGNDGARELDKLASSGSVVVAGAVDHTGRVASFSNVSARVETIYALGVNLFGPTANYQFAIWSGTSFSAGFVSGAAALAIERHPEAGPAEVRKRLLAGATPTFDAYGRQVPGGRVNLTAVVR